MAIALAARSNSGPPPWPTRSFCWAQARRDHCRLGSSFGYSPSMPTLGSVPGIDSDAVPPLAKLRFTSIRRLL
jgi:hypothetical protein